MMNWIPIIRLQNHCIRCGGGIGPDIADLCGRLCAVGLTSAMPPLGVYITTWLQAGSTTWDTFPETCGGKMDAETCGLETAPAHPNVDLRTECRVTRLRTDAKGRIADPKVVQSGQETTMCAPLIILAAGAVQTATLLLSSANDNYPTWRANRSDQVGHNFIKHNRSAVLALHPLKKNRAIYQKTVI